MFLKMVFRFPHDNYPTLLPQICHEYKLFSENKKVLFRVEIKQTSIFPFFDGVLHLTNAEQLAKYKNLGVGCKLGIVKGP